MGEHGLSCCWVLVLAGEGGFSEEVKGVGVELKAPVLAPVNCVPVTWY